MRPCSSGSSKNIWNRAKSISIKTVNISVACHLKDCLTKTKKPHVEHCSNSSLKKNHKNLEVSFYLRWKATTNLESCWTLSLGGVLNKWRLNSLKYLNKFLINILKFKTKFNINLKYITIKFMISFLILNFQTKN